MNLQDWVKEFLDLFFKGAREDAYLLKHENIPHKLYKYQPLDKSRIDSLLNDEIWFSTPANLNDPFDCRGIFWDEDVLDGFLKEKISKDKLTEFETTSDIVAGAIESARQHIQIACFSEELHSMPMWAHYAQNHTGICVEYDFSTVKHDSEFSKCMFPVGYQKDRYDITNLFKMFFENNFDPRVYLFFFLMQIKHKSWEYESEWRIIKATESGDGGPLKVPLKPTALYLGLKCEDSKLRDRLEKKIECPVYSLAESNNRFFDFDKACIKKP